MHWLVIPALALSCFLTVANADLALVAILTLTAMAGAWQFATGRWQMASFPAPLSWLLLGFTVWAGLSSLWTATPFDTWRAISVWLLLPVWAWILSGLPAIQVKKLVFQVGAVVAAMAVIAFWQMSLTQLDPNYRPPSLFANPNTLGALLALALLPLQHVWLGLQSGRPNDWRKILGAVALFIIFAGLALTVSRIAVLAYLAFTAIQLFVLKDIVRANWRSVALYAVGLIIIYISLNIETAGAIQQRFDYLSHPISRSERLVVWDTTWDAFLLQPVFGHGFGALSVPYAALRDPFDNTYGQFAHSDILQYFAELGVIGGALAVAIAGLFVWMSVARLRASFRDPVYAIWFGAVTTGIAYCIASACLTYILYLPALLIALAILFGVWAALYWVEEDTLPRTRRPVSAIAFFIGMLLLTSLHISSFMTAHADRELRAFSLEGHYEANRWASRLSFDLNPEVLLEWADVAISHASQTKNEAAFERIDNTLTRLERLQPSLPQLWMLRARLDLAQGRIEEGKLHLKQALGQDPTYVPALVMLGRLYRELGEEKTLDELYADALRYRVIANKYGANDIEALKSREQSLPRLTKSR